MSLELILDRYKKFPEREKELLKELLNDLLFELDKIEKHKQENQGKESILDNDWRRAIKDGTEIIEKIVSKADMKEIELIMKSNLQDKQLFKEIISELTLKLFGLKDLGKKECLLFNIYKGERKLKNNRIFHFRKRLLDFLHKEKIIIISKFNLLKKVHLFFQGELKFDDFKYSKRLLKASSNYIKGILDELREEEGEDIINQELEELKILQTKMRIVSFERNIILDLLRRIRNIELKNLEYKNGKLLYGGKDIYSPEESSDNEKILELLFSEPRGTYFKLNEIYNFIEGGGNYVVYLSKKQDKRVRNLYRRINEKVKDKTELDFLFSLGNGDNKGKLCRIY